MKSGLRNSFLLVLFLVRFFFFSSQSFAEETTYHFNFEKGAYFGEMYHVALGLLAEKNAYVYLPYISDSSDSISQEKLKQLEADPKARQALIIYGFLKQIGLTNRVIQANSRIPPIDNKVFGLVGKERPDGTGKFVAPYVKPLAYSTQAFERFIADDNEGNLKKAATLFTRSGTDPPDEVKKFIQDQITSKQANKKPLVAIWNRQDPSYQPERNMSRETLAALVKESITKGYTPMILGPPVDPSWVEFQELISQGDVLNMTELWKKQPFNRWDTQVTGQLDLFRELKKNGGLIGQIGMKGGALDGPAVAAGLPTIELVIPDDTKDDAANSRRILRFAHSIGNMTPLEVSPKGTVRNFYETAPANWIDLLNKPDALRRHCTLLYQFLSLRPKRLR